MLSKKSFRQIPMILIIAMFLTLPGFCESPASGVVYMDVVQRGQKTGNCLITENSAGGTLTLNEISYLPFEFFPTAVIRKFTFAGEKLRLLRLEELNRAGAAREKTVFSSSEGKSHILFDTGRFAYFLTGSLPPADSWPLDSSSPGLLFRFFQSHISMLPAEKTVDVEYYLPLEDFRSRRGTVTSTGKKLIFKGAFTAEAVTEFGRITEVSIPAESLKFKPVNSPELSLVEKIRKTGEGDGPVPGASSYFPEPAGYERIPVKFRARDGVVLSGILTVPKWKGPHPAFLLLSGSGPFDSSGGGLVSGIAHHLATAGVVTLSFDKRGVGESGGSYGYARFDDFLLDADDALNHLSSRPEADPLRMGVLGHSEGGLLAIRLAAENRHVRGLILLASPSVAMFPHMAGEQGKALFSSGRWNGEVMDQYQKSIALITDAVDRGLLWLNFEGSRVFLGVIASYQRWPDPIVQAKSLKMPVLILHGRDDGTVNLHHSYNLNLAFNEGGNPKTTLIVFTDTDHFFGQITPAGSTEYRRHVLLHPQAVKAVIDWVRPVYHLEPKGREE